MNRYTENLTFSDSRNRCTLFKEDRTTKQWTMNAFHSGCQSRNQWLGWYFGTTSFPVCEAGLENAATAKVEKMSWSQVNPVQNPTS